MTITKNGRRLMQDHLVVKQDEAQKLAQGVISTLAFFSLYNLPLSSKRIAELVFNRQAATTEVEGMLKILVESKKIIQAGNLYSIKPWDHSVYNANQLELTRKWAQIDRYFFWLSVLPFVRGVSVINSLALGTADSDSDIDFFVTTKKNRLYLVRSIIIVMFRMLGIYKTRNKIKDKFCFGFFADENSLAFEKLMLKPQDPYFVFWLASLRPVLGKQSYLRLMQDNPWLKNYFPNFELKERLVTINNHNPVARLIKFILEVVLWVPAMTAEPILGRIHINHTFKLAENQAVTSTTIATANLLKLHGYDVRAEVAREYERVLQSWR